MSSNESQTVLDLFRQAANDRRRGASEIEAELVRGLLGARSHLSARALDEGTRVLAEGQPLMANIRSLAARMAELETRQALGWLEKRSRVLEKLPDLLAAGAWPRLQLAPVAVTVSRSGAVAAVVEGAWSRGWRGMVVVLEGPEGSGGPDQAGRLASGGKAVLEPEARAPHWLDHPGALVVVGADAFGEDRFVNCAGTRILFELAAARGVDRVVIADSGKDVAEDVLNEIVAATKSHSDEIDRKWPLFEEVPSSLVTARINEFGLSVC